MKILNSKLLIIFLLLSLTICFANFSVKNLATKHSNLNYQGFNISSNLKINNYLNQINKDPLFLFLEALFSGKFNNTEFCENIDNENNEENQSKDSNIGLINKISSLTIKSSKKFIPTNHFAKSQYISIVLESPPDLLS